MINACIDKIQCKVQRRKLKYRTETLQDAKKNITGVRSTVSSCRNSLRSYEWWAPPAWLFVCMKYTEGTE